MTSSNAVQLLFLKQLPEILVAKLAGSSLGAEVVAAGVGGDIARPVEQFQLEAIGQLGDELLVSVGLVSAQLMIEMDHRRDDTELGAQFQHDSQEGYGIGSAGNGDTHAVTGVEELLATDVVEDALGQRAQGNIVHLGRRSTWVE
jgi:hypothetical protein